MKGGAKKSTKKKSKKKSTKKKSKKKSMKGGAKKSTKKKTEKKSTKKQSKKKTAMKKKSKKKTAMKKKSKKKKKGSRGGEEVSHEEASHEEASHEETKPDCECAEPVKEKPKKKRKAQAWMMLQAELGKMIRSKEGLNGIAEVSKRIQELITKAVGDKETRAKEGISYEHAVRKTLEEYKKNN